MRNNIKLKSTSFLLFFSTSIDFQTSANRFGISTKLPSYYYKYCASESSWGDIFIMSRSPCWRRLSCLVVTSIDCWCFYLTSFFSPDFHECVFTFISTPMTKRRFDSNLVLILKLAFAWVLCFDYFYTTVSLSLVACKFSYPSPPVTSWCTCMKLFPPPWTIWEAHFQMTSYIFQI